MNYNSNFSRPDINPIINDTAQLLSALRDRLSSRTVHNIPFFLMPVRTETRFMKVEHSLLATTIREATAKVVTHLTRLNQTLTAYYLYEAFDSQTAYNAALEIQDSFSSLSDLLGDVATVNPAEKEAVNYLFGKTGILLSAATSAITTACTDETLLDDLTENIIPAIETASAASESTFNAITDDTDWESNVSSSITGTVAPALAGLVSDASDQFANIIQSGTTDTINSTVFANYIAVLNDEGFDFPAITDGLTLSDEDKQYIWDTVSPLNDQFVFLYGIIEGLKASNATLYKNYDRNLYKATARLRDNWRELLLPGIDNAPLYISEPEISSRAADALSNSANMPSADELSTDITDLFDAISSDVNDAAEALSTLLDNSGGWDDDLFNDYTAPLQDIIAQLDLSDVSNEDAQVYLWQQMSLLNDQYTSLNDFIQAQEVSDPSVTVTRMASLQTLFYTLNRSWLRATAATLSKTAWLSFTYFADELWIRVYPDDIFINSLERELTDDEVTAATEYWNAWNAAYGDPDLQLAAWQHLVALYGPERAAWIAHTSTPTNIAVLDTSPVFVLFNYVNLLNNYTFQIANLNAVQNLQAQDAAANQSVTTGSGPQVSDTLNDMTAYLEFYSPQLDYATSVVATIEGLPQSYADKLTELVTGAKDNFHELSKSLYAVAKDQASLQVTLTAVNHSFNTFLTAIDTIQIIGDWTEIYNATPEIPTEIDTKSYKWNEPSYSNVVPDRFLFAAVNTADNRTVPTDDINYGSHTFNHIKIGNLVPDPLYTSIDPLNADFTETAIHNLQTDPNILWMVDFYEAVAKGMAVSIALTSLEAQKGFDKILVLGLKLKETSSSVTSTSLPGIGKDLLEKLLENHHYTHGGMEFLTVGTATNNTDENDAGYNIPDPLAQTSFNVEQQGPLFTPTGTVLNKKDGQWLADALGIDYSAFTHIKNADKTQISNSIAINRALWEGTIGNYMRDIFNAIFTDDNIGQTKDYFCDYVLARGTLPSIRIGDQPYGILPTTSFTRWDWMFDHSASLPQDLYALQSDDNSSPVISITDYLQTFLKSDYDNITDALADYINASPPMSPALTGHITDFDAEKFFRDRHLLRFSKVLEILNATWLEIAKWHVKTVDKNTGNASAQNDFIEMLGSDALMAEAYSRFYVSNAQYNNQFLLNKLKDNNSTQTSPPYFWSSPPADIINIPDRFLELFNNLSFDPLIPGQNASNPNPLGSAYPIFDIPDFLDYSSARLVYDYAGNFSPPLSSYPADVLNLHPIEGFSAAVGHLPIPAFDRIKNQMRLFSVNMFTDKYSLKGITVDENKLSENTILPHINNAYNYNYIHWLRTKDLTSIWNYNNFHGMPSRSLLYLLLRQSTLLTYRETALDLLEYDSIISKAARKLIGTPEGMTYQQAFAPNGLYVPVLTKWHFLFRSIDSLAHTSDFAGAYKLFTGKVSDQRSLILPEPGDDADAPTFGNLYGSITERYKNHGFPVDTDPSAPYPDPVADPNPLNLPGWDDTKILSSYLKSPDNSIPNIDFTRINKLNAALDHLKILTTAELDRLVREHIDLCTYRLDAWNYGMANKRLWERRNVDGDDPSGSRVTGIYLGAYGWVLNVRPKPALQLVNNEHIPSQLTNTDKVYYDKTNLGFIHTPSQAHALSAAILRCGYISENNAEDNRFAVNLTSERVNLALSLIEGVRNGQPMAAILGYEFERGLHERYPSLNLDQYIYTLRRKYPLVDADNILNPNVAQQAETVRPANVVDGIEMLNALRTNQNIKSIMDSNPHSSIYALYDSNPSFGSYALSVFFGNNAPFAANSQEFDAIMAELDRIANSVDALGDIAIAEGVFQLAQGNYSRASSTVEALTEGKNPVDPEMIKTPQTGTHLTHRLAAMFTPYDSTTTIPNPWDPSVTLTIRAKAEPNVNWWLAKILVAVFEDTFTIADLASAIGCRASFTDVNGQPQDIAVGISDIALQPIDLLYHVQLGDYKEELTRRITYYARVNGAYEPNPAPAGVPVDIPITVVLGDKSVGFDASYMDILAVLSAASSVITGSRWLKADDFITSPNAATTTSPPTPLFNASEIYNRADTLSNDLGDLISDFSAYIPVQNIVSLDPLRILLISASYFNISYAIPDAAIEDIDNAIVLADISQTFQKVYDELVKRKALADDLIAEGQAAASEAQVQKYADAISAILGSEFKVLPHFSFDFYTGLKDNIDAILTATGNDDIMVYANDADEAMDKWLYGLARVQEKTEDIETIRILALEDNTHPLKDIRPVQLPYHTANTSPVVPTDFWLGMSYPDTYVPPTGDKLSVSVFDYEQLSPASPPAYAYYCGIMINEWNELLPSNEELTNIAFNYDQPNAKPPQNVLLAICPQTLQPADVVNKHWKVEDLLHTLLDTMDMAKIRMVEPDHFKKVKEAVDFNGDFADGLNQTQHFATNDDVSRSEMYEMFKWLLPAISGEVVPYKTMSEPNQYEGAESVQQVSFDYNPNNDGPPVVDNGPAYPDQILDQYPGPVIFNANAVDATAVINNNVLQNFFNAQYTLSQIADIQIQIINLQQ